jgi:hypothetical protein
MEPKEIMLKQRKEIQRFIKELKKINEEKEKPEEFITATIEGLEEADWTIGVSIWFEDSKKPGGVNEHLVNKKESRK